ncbi:hypothetical protein [Companilactobacillus baiquanensis]|uniref:Type II secretion system protein n=1 Tax=Companilactobacillus baiquanensis TaxID=2486005 RepID=A0ABW1UUD4_9LACO|nr:hypothetical protein [Companilactobacillus baiquanensis]
MKKIRSGFVLAESVVSLFITLLVAVTLTTCLGAQYKQIKTYEQRITAHKLMLINLDSEKNISKQTMKGEDYFFYNDKNSLKVKSGREVYQVEW